jgi:ribonuclease VapC
MIVDTSALVAIVRNEPERRMFLERLSNSRAAAVSAVTWMEARLVVFSRMGEPGLTVLRNLVTEARIEVVAVSSELSDVAFAAFRRFGKGRDPAALNFGDCFAYALARHRNEPLLFKGDDFARTDITPATQVA